MKLTKGVVSRKEAVALAPDYVAFTDGAHEKFGVVDKVFAKLRKGQKVLTRNDDVFVIAKVSSINHDDFRAVDGPIVRVSNGEYSWRVDGDRFAYPLKA